MCLARDSDLFGGFEIGVPIIRGPVSGIPVRIMMYRSVLGPPSYGNTQVSRSTAGSKHLEHGSKNRFILCQSPFSFILGVGGNVRSGWLSRSTPKTVAAFDILEASGELLAALAVKDPAVVVLLLNALIVNNPLCAIPSLLPSAMLWARFDDPLRNELQSGRAQGYCQA